MASTITTGGNLTATVGNDINVSGSNVTATGDATLTATNDEYHFQTYRSTSAKRKSLAGQSLDSKEALGFGSDKTSNHETQTVTQVASNISGNNVSINSGANSRGCFQPDCHQQC
jgi:hypothetical protein